MEPNDLMMPEAEKKTEDRTARTLFSPEKTSDDQPDPTRSPKEKARESQPDRTVFHTEKAREVDNAFSGWEEDIANIKHTIETHVKTIKSDIVAM